MILVDHIVDHLAGACRPRSLDRSSGSHDFETLAKDHLALIIHHVIEFQTPACACQSCALRPWPVPARATCSPRGGRWLRPLSCPGRRQHLVSSRSDPKMRIRSSSSDRKKDRPARIPLTPRTAAQLVVDPSAFMTFGSQNITDRPASSTLAFFSSACLASISAARNASGSASGSSCRCAASTFISTLPPS